MVTKNDGYIVVPNIYQTTIEDSHPMSKRRWLSINHDASEPSQAIVTFDRQNHQFCRTAVLSWSPCQTTGIGFAEPTEIGKLTMKKRRGVTMGHNFIAKYCMPREGDHIFSITTVNCDSTSFVVSTAVGATLEKAQLFNRDPLTGQVLSLDLCCMDQLKACTRSF